MNGMPAVEIGSASVIKLARGVRLREDAVRKQTVLLAPERAIALDEIAVAIVNALDGKRSLDEIAGSFSLEFDAPKDEVLRDIITFAREFSHRRMLEIVS